MTHGCPGSGAASRQSWHALGVPLVLGTCERHSQGLTEPTPPPEPPAPPAPTAVVFFCWGPRWGGEILSLLHPRDASAIAEPSVRTLARARWVKASIEGA